MENLSFKQFVKSCFVGPGIVRQLITLVIVLFILGVVGWRAFEYYMAYTGRFI